MLIETETDRLLVDTGPGDKLTTKEREIFALQGGTVAENLLAAGLAPESIDYVVLSHLHFDHAGGGTRRRDDTITASFPSAIYCIQEREWEAEMVVDPNGRVAIHPRTSPAWQTADNYACCGMRKKSCQAYMGFGRVGTLRDTR